MLLNSYNKLLNQLSIVGKIALVLFSILFIFLSFNLRAQVLPDQEAVPGGVVKINLNIPVNKSASKNSQLPEAFFQDKKLLVYPHNGTYYTLIGLPLNLKPGDYNIKFKIPGSSYQYQSFSVTDKKYKISRIKIKNNNMVNPDPKTQDRIISDLKTIRTAVNNYTDTIPRNLILKQPVKGIPTTSFGAKRIINGQSKNPHSGMDIAAPTATPVVAAADGKVILAENFYLSGNVVAIDHGSGFVTMYAHLSQILAKKGEQVKTGEKIGRVGSTGRVTGPHLHWTVRLNETPVNPDLFLEKIKPISKL